MPKARTTNAKANGSALGFEAQLWAAAEKNHKHRDRRGQTLFIDAPPRSNNNSRNQRDWKKLSAAISLR